MLLLLLIILLAVLCLVEREIDFSDPTREPDMTDNCFRCSSEVVSDMLICPECHSLLREHCEGCGESKAVSHRFCPWCGESSKAKGQKYAA